MNDLEIYLQSIAEELVEYGEVLIMDEEIADRPGLERLGLYLSAHVPGQFLMIYDRRRNAYSVVMLKVDDDSER